MSRFQAVRKVTNEDLRAVQRFLEKPHPLFMGTWLGLWIEDPRSRQELICELLGLPVSLVDKAWTEDTSHGRYTAIQEYLMIWMNQAHRATFSTDEVRFNPLQTVLVNTHAMTCALESKLGSDPMLAQIVMMENIVIAFALAWRVCVGDEEIYKIELAP